MCDPYKYRVESRLENVNFRVLKYLLIVIMVSLIINFPKFFEIQIVQQSFGNRTVFSFDIRQNFSHDVKNIMCRDLTVCPDAPTLGSEIEMVQKSSTSVEYKCMDTRKSLANIKH